MRAVIFANGVIEDYSNLHSLLRGDDLLIAADGGAAHCDMIGLRPHIVIGDMDSISPHLREDLSSKGVEFIIFEKDKDQTDLELAISYAKKQGVMDLILFGLTGNRIDQTLANLLLLARDEWGKMTIAAIDGPDQLFFLRGRQECSIDGNPGDLLSLIPLTEKVEGVSSQGLRWHLANAALYLGSTRGISNEMLSTSARVSIRDGKLLLVHRKTMLYSKEK